MPEFIQRRIDVDLKVEEIEELFTGIERSGLSIGPGNTPVSLVRLRAGATANGVPGNLAEFESVPALTGDEIVLVTDVPADPEAKVGFFTKILQRDLEIVSYADVFIRGVKTETVVCRKESAVSPEPATPVPVPNPPPTPPTPTPPAPVPVPAPPPSSSPSILSDKAVALIVESEGFDQPSRWPGGASGITIGIGYDLGYNRTADFRNDWAAHLPSAHIDRLTAAIEVTGSRARGMAPRFRDITIPRPGGFAVFKTRTLPRFHALTRRTFPGMDKLPPDAQGALVSLVYNRGSSLSGARRSEMREIRDLIAGYRDGTPMQPLLDRIAQEFKSMKRLWAGVGLDGLLRRRDAEARLVRESLA